MKEPKDFLTRWSRRKLNPAEEVGAGRGKNAPPAGKSSENPVSKTGAPLQSSPAAIDLDKLPSIESIVAGTDVRAFLQRGVPAALTRAALRRAWSADPAIRDFIGLSENSWDFNASDSMHGFGPLDDAEVRRLAAQLFDKADESVAANHSSADRHSFTQPAPELRESGNAAPHEMRNEALERKNSDTEFSKNCDKKADVVISTETGVGTQAHSQKDDAERDSAPAHRRHGGALPK